MHFWSKNKILKPEVTYLGYVVNFGQRMRGSNRKWRILGVHVFPIEKYAHYKVILIIRLRSMNPFEYSQVKVILIKCLRCLWNSNVRIESARR